MEKNNNFLTIIIVVSFFMLVGCYGKPNIVRYDNIDQSQKSITVPPGSIGLKGEMKRVLFENGWKLMIDRGPSVTEGVLDKNVNIKQYDTFNTRYRLYVRFSQFDWCAVVDSNYNPALNVDISFIDNKTGSEVFTIEGRSCQSDVIEEFTKAIKEVKVIKE